MSAVLTHPEIGREDSNLRMAGVSLPCYGSIASLLLE